MGILSSMERMSLYISWGGARLCNVLIHVRDEFTYLVNASVTEGRL